MDKFENVDCSPIIGCEIIQVCIGQYQVQIHMQGGASVVIESDFTCESSDVASDTRNFVDKGATLVSILGAHITDISGRSGETAVFSFSNGRRLVVSLEETGYENMQIITKDGGCIV
jgi:hypothetical protein